MSNHLGVAVVTAALHRRVQNAVQAVAAGVTVQIGPPRAPTPGEVEVDVYLYHVGPNAQLRNHDLATRDHHGDPVQRPLAAIDVHYLVSFSAENQLLGAAMLGKVIAVLHEQPVFSAADAPAAARLDPAAASLTAAGWPPLMRQVVLTPHYPSLEDVTKLWSVFFQIPHRPSLHYVASPIILAGGGEAHPRPARRVKRVELVGKRDER